MEGEEKAKAALERLCETAEPLGLYMDWNGASWTSQEGRVFVSARLTVGEVASRDRVLDPEADALARDIAAMEQDMLLDDWNTARALAERGKVFDDD